MTSNHEGVSCDCCRKNNFKGLRYKCLICYDYDLCSNCHETGLTSSRHTVNHPMQCIIARNDYDLFYAGESVTPEQPQSLTCPLCGTLGFNESTLLEHVTTEHVNSDREESSAGVVCPICGAETNQLTYDFATHLSMEHRAPRDQMEQITLRGRGGRCLTRTCVPRGRRSQPHYNTVAANASSRESADPLVEIIAQLSGVRRAGGASSQSHATQLHQLQMHLQSSPSFSPRATNDVRIMRRTFQSMNNHMNSNNGSAAVPSTMTSTGTYANPNSNYCSNQPFVLLEQSSLGSGIPNGAANNLCNGSSSSAIANQSNQDGINQSTQYLLSRCLKPTPTETERQNMEILKADRSLFVQELLLQVGLLEKDNQ